MSLQLIQQYYAKVDKIIQYGGERNESALRFAFQMLLESYCADKSLELIAELDYKTRSGATVRPDGTLKDALRQDWGYWESKDQYDVLDEEIEKKLAKGYPSTNILFEDSQTAVLIQEGREVARVVMQDAAALHALLTAFVSYQPPEVQTFRAAIERFKADLPGLVVALRRSIEEQATVNPAFVAARAAFLKLCQEAINPALELADVREMLIQHILTEDIFIAVFGEDQFHRENNIARELHQVLSTFFTGTIRREIYQRMSPYVNVIKAAASAISNHHEKQRFLKVVYENFYKTYNPAGADRLGIVYTPNEIVRFMIESADFLVQRHFGRLLADQEVEILDPATGTGTFITELIEYLPKHLLPYKYTHEIHCNEVAILPYYIAHLNIEYTYAQKMGAYRSFENLCFVDTLDNTGFMYAGKQYTFDFMLENLERIQRQNRHKISVIIGNPPYNANQLNENENNKNREYPEMDARIKDTYIRASTAQKTKLYDMYARFLPWASDRLQENGVIAFVSNNSFIDARTYDGFRKVVAEEFNAIYIIDMKGNARTSGERRRREGGNVFNDAIRVGIAIYFLVRQAGAEGCRIYYTCVDDYTSAAAEQAYLRDNKFQNLPFAHIRPDDAYNWINLAKHHAEWASLLPVGTKETKTAGGQVNAIFKVYSLGIVTNRDEWVYDYAEETLEQKVKFLIAVYNREVDRLFGNIARAEVEDAVDYSIKWTRAIKNDLVKGKKYVYDCNLVIDSLYRPFVKKKLYFSKELNEMQYQTPLIFPNRHAENVILAVNVGNKSFNVLASKYLVDLHFNGDTQCFPLYRYEAGGTRVDNITDWALAQFQGHYADAAITRRDIFAYVYAVLHDPAYREKYALNLKREFPRIPFYADFAQWAAWGQQLLDLHLDYETVAPYPLQRLDSPFPAPGIMPKALLKADPAAGTIALDTTTTLTGVPPAAWEYRLGNRSALEWVLEYHKERAPKDPTIREKFDTYRFADYKEPVIDLLRRVCTVSAETLRIIAVMRPSPIR